MRLRQIKLAGFKSFVDPTQIDVPGRLVGVVGPNGCGKSNVIDAVRWVLGESKAAELRGESMQDVIFNGSSQRKPGGRASVELVFDNTETPEQRTLGGPWASYAEISVKRVLTRDGTSNYSINNQAVRRRDVQDMFLGTGLGPRAYAIIGQGMITRIIEARPEELRIFLEEAAGVSKYKERRREAENRLADTRDNLTRVEDIVRELARQIDKLEQQAEIAQHYRAQQAEHDEQQQLLWLTRKREAGAEQSKVAQEVATRAAALEAHIADLRAVELALEQTRTAHYAQSDAVHAAQGDLLNVNAEVSKLESELRLLADARARLQTQIEALRGTRERRRTEQDDLAQRAVDLERQLSDGVARLSSARIAVVAQEQSLPAHEQTYAQAREALTATRSLAFAAEQAIEAAGSEQRALERQRAALSQRRERLQEENRELGEPDESRLAHLRAEAERLGAELAAATERLAQAEAGEQQARAERQQHADTRARAAEALTRLEARQQAAQELQSKIEADDRLDPWLKAQGLDTLPRLFQRLQVEPGWEAAFEAVLRERIEALEVIRLDSLAGLAASAPPARVAFYSTQGALGVAAGSLAGFAPLAAYLRGHDAALAAVLADWLVQVYVAPDLQAALAARASLPPGGQLVVQAGHLVGRHGVRCFAADDRKSGLLARRHEIENLERETRAQRLIAEQAAAAFARAESQARQAAESVIAERQKADALRVRVHAVQIDVVRLTELTERVKHRAGQIDAELAELASHERDLLAGRSDADARFEQLDAELAGKQEAVEIARVGYEDADRMLRAARELLQQRAADANRIEFELTAARERQQDIAHAVRVAAEDADRLAADSARAQDELTQLDDGAIRSGLDQWLAQRVGREDALRGARSRLDEIASELRRTDELRLTREREQQPLRDRITELQLKEQAARLSFEQFAEQLAQASADEISLGAKLDAMTGALRTRASTIQSELARLAESIAGLGAVNLAALDELAAGRERKSFLDAQSADLTAAMTTLEDAIRKIDLETRALLQQTFTQVNQHFGMLFPKLFGGGEARLLMTGDEILDAGVQVMAQPPGKRNSTIHLLSGGEKALAATALVFALFKLNPAPFCLLDEVDAALDDSNTERFCALVRSMIGSTQFLFITHNKIAMEMAEQLIGVTMQEQGVSRIVAVDIDAAIRLTAEAA